MRGKYPKDLTGIPFGRWMPLRRDPTDENAWLCVCSPELDGCGTERAVKRRNLVEGNSKSCGCLARELARKVHTTHGGHGKPEYAVWEGMIQRCTNPKAKRFPRYGGRGITVCGRWRDFGNFYADMGPRPSPEYSLERKDAYGSYEPGNVVWATAPVQTRNQSGNFNLTLRGITHCATDWAILTGLTHETIFQRKMKGWSDEETLTRPAMSDGGGNPPGNVLSKSA